MILSNLSFGEDVTIHPSTKVNNVHFGNNIKIAKECTILGGEAHVVKIGSGTILGMYVTLEGSQADIELGEHVSIAQHNVIVSDWGLAPGSAINKLFARPAAPIKIGDHSWIGSGCVIAPGVTIGKYSIVASNSYVDADVPDFAIFGGNPARFIRSIDPNIVFNQKAEE
ncbi:acyltransferase [Geofilum rubicundum]|uniref:Acetyltransferase n=1 Tax=Geofilum rubicundum JCM 15548 TaxID=1236989 RepID=A0A0E9LTQ2_9BACT|nr:acyltransferase [Geofilum rubicundum]GAO28506.1 acetyltransferase [Geofilum rubicundum JCM 15548]